MAGCPGSRQVNAGDPFEFLPKNPIEVFHVVRVNRNELNAELVITRHLVFHGSLIFVPVVIVVHVKHSPVFDIDVIIRQIKIRCADLLRENPNACFDFLFVLVPKSDGIEIIGNLLFSVAANFHAKFCGAASPVLFTGKENLK